MGLKDLFIISDEADKKKEVKEVVKEKTITKFPTNETTPSTTTSTFGFGSSTPSPSLQISSNDISQEHLTKFLDMYQKGFDALNQAGYDFYEFFQSVCEGGLENSQVYAMAFKMGTVMDKTITKEKLLSQSEFYCTEILKSYNQYVTSGSNKKQELVSQKETENQTLTNDLSLLKQQLENITIQIKNKESKLSLIDDKYQPLLAEVDSKLKANEFAKSKLISTIEQVKQGITNNLK